MTYRRDANAAINLIEKIYFDSIKGGSATDRIEAAAELLRILEMATIRRRHVQIEMTASAQKPRQKRV